MDNMTKKYKGLEELMLNQFTMPVKLLTDYKTLGLQEVDLMVILHIHRFLQAGNTFPTPAELAEYVTVTETEVTQYLRKLIQKNMLEIKELSAGGELSEAYSLQPLWQKLMTEEQPNEPNHEGTIFILFEQEFGRPLSPFEIETITIWLDEDKMQPALIKAGLREAVLMGKLNFKYIDRILREWRHKGIRSVEEAREESKAFHKGQPKKQYQTEKRDTSVYFNWIKGEE